jgi:hypothetical protein
LAISRDGGSRRRIFGGHRICGQAAKPRECNAANQD